jgi:SAM-dependent methyltransferase
MSKINPGKLAESWGCDAGLVEPTRRNREAWDIASRKYVEEADALDAEELAPVERRLLAPVLATSPRVVHLQSGNGTDCIDLLRAGASSVVGVDFSSVAVVAATSRARRLSSEAQYVVGAVPQTPLAGGVADLIYTGKGALIWLSDLASWALEVFRLLAPRGCLFVYDAHPAAPLWTHDVDRTSLELGRSYFGATRVNDTFPASAIRRFGGDDSAQAVEWQWTLGDIVNSIIKVGLMLEHLGEHPEPFWRPQSSPNAAAWNGELPNSFTLIARRP